MTIAESQRLAELDAIEFYSLTSDLLQEWVVLTEKSLAMFESPSEIPFNMGFIQNKIEIARERLSK